MKGTIHTLHVCKRTKKLFKKLYRRDEIIRIDSERGVYSVIIPPYSNLAITKVRIFYKYR